MPHRVFRHFDGAGPDDRVRLGVEVEGLARCPAGTVGSKAVEVGDLELRRLPGLDDEPVRVSSPRVVLDYLDDGLDELRLVLL